MERELCFCSDNGCLCNNSVSQAHLRNCFLSADWSQQRWGESTPSSQNAVCPSSLSSGPKWPAFSHWCRTASTAARRSSAARRGTAFYKMIRTYWNYRHIWFVFRQSHQFHHECFLQHVNTYNATTASPCWPLTCSTGLITESIRSSLTAAFVRQTVPLL